MARRVKSRALQDPERARRQAQAPPLPQGGDGVKPRADFSCLSGKCDKKGRLVTYELPVNAQRCPVCGSKKIKRLYDRVNVNLGAKPQHFNGRATSSSMAAR